MQKIIYKEDGGKKFGKWGDPISKFMYHDSINDILKEIIIPENVADYGGANGILKKYIKNIVSIDIDESKDPDIVDDILTHQGKYDLVVIRFVLHYLTDAQIKTLFENMKSEKVLVIQFVNDDLKAKYSNSQNEAVKHFRTKKQLLATLPKDGKIIYEAEYYVDENFYTNRLGVGKYTKHGEKILAIKFEKK